MGGLQMMIDSLHDAERVARRVAIVGMVLLLIPVAVMTAWTLDRSSPFELLTYSAPPVRAGEVLRIDGVVRRDMDRACSITYSRFIYDNEGRQFYEGPITFVNPPSLIEQNRQMGGKFKVDVAIPKTANPGAITIVTNLDYVCNPMHLWWPIEVTVIVNSEVLP